MKLNSKLKYEIKWFNFQWTYQFGIVIKIALFTHLSSIKACSITLATLALGIRVGFDRSKWIPSFTTGSFSFSASFVNPVGLIIVYSSDSEFSLTYVSILLISARIVPMTYLRKNFIIIPARSSIFWPADVKQINRFLSVAFIALMIGLIESLYNVTSPHGDVGGDPKHDKTASTWANSDFNCSSSNIFALTATKFLCWISDSLDGFLTMARTACPASRACCVKHLPVGPVAPRIATFSMGSITLHVNVFNKTIKSC